MRHHPVTTLAPLALLVSSAALAAPRTSQLRPLCVSGLPARCQTLAEVPASATIPGPELAARISVANCMAEDAMSRLQLQPDRGSIYALDHAAQPSLAMLEDVIANGADEHYRDVARAARADLLHGMIVRIRIVANDPQDRHGLETRLALWNTQATRTIAQGPSCPAPDTDVAI